MYIAVFLIVTAKLFFEPQFNAMVHYIAPEKASKSQLLKIGVSDPIVSRDPRANDVGSRMYLLQVFEPLIRRTPTLELESSLALSYGMLSPNQWEFRLRPGVVFHDGSDMRPEDVKASLEYSREKKSAVNNLLSTISTIESKENTIIITTKEPDVLLPQKMASVLIFKQIKNDFIGTGPYYPGGINLNSGDSKLLNHFEDYWGGSTAYKQLALISTITKAQKLAALEQGSVDILMNIPADVALDFTVPNYRLVVEPGLETDMLFMNTQGVLGDLRLRKILQAALEPATLVRFAHGFATVADQLVTSSIFGYNPSLSLPLGNMKVAQDLKKQLLSEEPIELIITLPKGLESVGNAIAAQFAKIQISLSSKIISGQELNKKIVQSSLPFYFFGWKHELGDSLPFLASVLHSRTELYGEFNGMNYANPRVDSLIEEALKTSDPARRRELQREVLTIALVDDAIAIPLFSPDVLFAVKDGVTFSPRVDGYVLASDFVLQ